MANHPVNGQSIKKPCHITQERLKELLHYDPETGVFTWLVRMSQRVMPGDIAGGRSHEYLTIKIFGKTYKAHRLAWLYVYGDLPSRVDHRDGQGSHNWIENLRPCTQVQNVANSRVKSNNVSGLKGVRRRKGCRNWEARICVGRRSIHLG